MDTLLPIFMAPKIFAPAPTSQLSPIIGQSSFVFLFPIVTPCLNEQFLPIFTLGVITIPE